jgi:hypothetical protein
MPSVRNMADMWYPQQVEHKHSPMPFGKRVEKNFRLSGRQHLPVTSDEILHACTALRCSYVQKGPTLIDFCAKPNSANT